jgi:hypothetical protein
MLDLPPGKPSNRQRSAWPCDPIAPVDDASLLANIQADVAASPFSGEGHHKVWARLH